MYLLQRHTLQYVLLYFKCNKVKVKHFEINEAKLSALLLMKFRYRDSGGKQE